jgi:hypothetical protein
VPGTAAGGHFIPTLIGQNPNIHLHAPVRLQARGGFHEGAKFIRIPRVGFKNECLLTCRRGGGDANGRQIREGKNGFRVVLLFLQ